MNIEDMEIERFKRMGGFNYWTEVEVNENQYILEFNMPESDTTFLDTIFVNIWATPTGEYHPPPDDPIDLGTTISSKRTPHEKVHRKDVKYGKLEQKYGSFSSFINEALNKAICIVEEKEEQTETMKDHVRAALEANKEVHGGIDYELEKADE